MSDAGLNNWKDGQHALTIDVLCWPASIQCTACGYAMLQDDPCNHLKERAVIVCVNKSCANTGLRLICRPVRVACEVVKDATP